MRVTISTQKQVTEFGMLLLIAFLTTATFLPEKTTTSNVLTAQFTLTKEINCITQAASGIAGNVDATFRLRLTNTGDMEVGNLQMVENLAAQIPGSVFAGVVNATFGPGTTASANPNFNLSFDGQTDSLLFDGTSGTLAGGEIIEVDLVVELMPGVMTPYQNLTNAAFAFGIDMMGDTISITSDAPPGTPGDTGGQLDSTLLWVPAINVAKNAFGLTENCALASGNVELTLQFFIQNTGNVNLDNISLDENLASQFGGAFLNIVSLPQITASTAMVNPSINPFFTGTGVNTKIFTGTTGLLSPGQTLTVHVRILMDPNAGATFDLLNQVVASGRGLFPDNSPLAGCNGGQLLAVDFSDSGTNPLSQNIGAPGDTGGSDDPTPLFLPGLQVAKNIAGVDIATSGINGHFDVIFEVVLKNTGNVNLNNLSLIDNLSSPAFFGSAFVSVVQAPQIVVIGAHGTLTTVTSNPVINAAWNGSGDLFLGGGLLGPNEVLVLQFRAEVNPTAPGAPAQPKNMVDAFAEGTGPDGLPLTVTDLSDSGYFPENTNPGQPGDTGGHCDPTPLTNCWNLIGNGLTCNNLVQVSLNPDCIAQLSPPMVLEGEFENCADADLLPLGAYYFIAMVTTQAGFPVPDADPSTANFYEIDGTYVGQTLVVKVMDVVYENSCWGQIHLEDKMPPIFNCPSTPVEVSCAANLADIPPPAVTDNCDANPQISLVGQQVVDNDICDDGIYRILRTWKAFDDFGNGSANCIQTIDLIRPPVDFPEDITWQCSQYSDFPNITDPTPLHPAISDTNSGDLDIDVWPGLPASVLSNTGSGTPGNTGGVCMYQVSHSDQVLQSCGVTFKVIRTWSVFDWCTNQFVTTGIGGEDNQQVIKIMDTDGPTIDRPPFTVSANIPGQHPQLCRSTGFLLPPIVSDNCNAVTVQILTPVGEAEYIGGNGINGGFIPLPGLPVGTHTVTYIATDSCGNETSLNVQVSVVDDITPAAVCETVTEVTLNSDGYAEVFASTFDDGSNDNCCIDHFEVRRAKDLCLDGHDDLVFGPSVFFCCEDVFSVPTDVIFRVYDCHGNFNDCLVKVNVRDKTEPFVLSCPSNQRITCDFYQQNLENQLEALAGDEDAQSLLLDPLYGSPVFFDNCGFDVAREIDINLNQCSEGSILRIWSATDPSTNESQVCTQTIFVDHVSDWVVEFPADITVTCGQAVPDFGEPEIFFDNCEMIAVSFLDEVFTVVPDACYKIIRNWQIINWCVVGSSVDQEVTEQAENQLGLPPLQCDLDGDGDCDNRTFRDSWRSGPAINRPTAAQANQSTIPDTDLDSDPWDGYITYQQIIKVIDTMDPVFVNGCPIPIVIILDTVCETTVTLPIPVVTDCSPDISITADGDLGTGMGPFPGVGPGTYNVLYTATDNCNNSTTCSTTVTVIDGKKPTPYCKDGLIIEIMAPVPPDTLPMISVTASDFDAGSFDNCPGALKFSFSSDVSDVTRTFDCSHIGQNILQIWVTDASGNQDFCVDTLSVQDNMSLCMDDTLVVQLGGFISSEEGENVEGVSVQLSGQSSGNETTTADGGYLFTGIPSGNDLTVTPVKDDGPLNGVSTYDLVLIGKHILGVQPLDSPYKLIAADANRSGSVTTFDLVEIRKLILFINTEFSNNTSWRFVDKNYVFPVPANPWAQAFPEVISVNNIPADVLDADFIAIKIGDVNGSASLNYFGGNGDRSSGGSLIFKTEDTEFQRGEIFTATVSAEDFQATGFQFTLDFDPQALEFLEVGPGLARTFNFGTALLEKGALTVSWHSTASVNLAENEAAFTLIFKAKKSGRLSDWLTLNSRFTPAEAYSPNGEPYDIELAFDSPGQKGFALYQNVPNPFRRSTVIGFHLPEASPAVLTVTSLSGQVVKTVRGDFSKGYHEVEVTKAELGGSGVFLYRLDTPGNTAVRKAVVID